MPRVVPGASPVPMPPRQPNSRHPGDQAASPDPTERVPGSGAATTSSASASSSGVIRILLALAYPITREGTRHILELEADLLVVGEAADAREAFRSAEELQPDLLVLDLDLLISGADTLRAARARLGRIAILVLNVDAPDTALLTSGITGVLPRSASSADLLAAIRAIAKNRQYGVEEPAPLQEAPTARELQV